MTTRKKLILASASPRRKQLLELLGLTFIIYPSEIEEKLTHGLTPREQVKALSKQKAETVGKKFANALILGADTMVAFGNEVIGKPKDEKDAKHMLRKFSGSTHSIVTGFTLLDTNTKKFVTKSSETKVWFRKMTTNEISSFVEREKPLDNAGAYAIHELAGVFIEKIEGDCNGAMGISLFQLYIELKKFGIEVL